VRFRQSGAISKRSIRRSLCSGRRRKTSDGCAPHFYS
jgi:hypothetical protein